MTNNKFKRPTSYIACFWDEDGGIIVEQKIYPMHLYSLDDIFENLKGRERECDIYEGRYSKKRGKYVTTALTYIWDGCQWIEGK